MLIDIDSDHPVIPSGMCCCCGEKSVHLKRVGASKAIRPMPINSGGWYFPYCAECIRHVNAAEAGGVVLLVGFVASAWAVWSLDVEWALLVACSAALLMVIQRYLAYGRRTSVCASGGSAIRLRRWSNGVNTFEFKSDAYAQAFLRANPCAFKHGGKAGAADASEISAKPFKGDESIGRGLHGGLRGN